MIEAKIVPLLERIAVAVERGPSLGLAAAPEPSGSANADDLRDRIDAARQVNDSEGAMALRDDLARVVSIDVLKEVDQSLVKWLMSLIQRRLRGGSIRPDVVELASRVAERFGATIEGASLKAALPTLRRSAGLCPRCAEPYTGVADACPKCLVATNPAPTDTEVESADDADLEPQGGPVDLNNDDLWKVP